MAEELGGVQTGQGPPELAGFGWAALRTAWDHSPVLVGVVMGPEHRLVYVNDAVEALFGPRPMGIPMSAAYPGMDMSALSRFDEVLRTGRTVEVEQRQVPIPDQRGADVVLKYVLCPLGAPGEPPAGVVMCSVDVTAQAGLERTSARNGLLADISAGMNATTAPVEALRALTDQLVPSVADVAAVFVTPEGIPNQADTRAPVALTVAPSLADLGPPPAGDGQSRPTPWDETLAAGVAVVVPVTAANLHVLAPGAAMRQWLTESAANSLAILPLVVAGSMAGAVVLAATGARRPFDTGDLAFLEDVAARAGAAVTHVRTVRRSAEVALDLQRALLPSAPPTFPDLVVAARYVAGGADVQVGGDWWDVADLGAGRVALGVGDVSGRGVPAAVVMGQARAAMRAAGLAHLSPAQVLTMLDAQVSELVQMADHGPHVPPLFATALYGVFEPVTASLCVSNAGHLPMLVRRPGGRVDRVDLPPGSPLGLGLGDWDEIAVPFPAGATLAMFTDGLVESRDQDVDDGLAQLADAFSRLGAAPDLEEVAQGLIDALGRTDGHADDVALVLMRADQAAFPRASLDRVIHQLSEVASARKAAAVLVAGDAPSRSVLAEQVEHVVAELLANALEHGRSAAALHVHVTGARVVVEVTDQSMAQPRLRTADQAAERGRGLALTGALSSRWGVRTGPEGKTVWAELALTPA